MTSGVHSIGSMMGVWNSANKNISINKNEEMKNDGLTRLLDGIRLRR